MNRRLHKMKRPSLLCLLLVIGMTAPLSSVQSGMLTINNAGFETPTNAEEYITPFTLTQHLTGWTYYNPDDINYWFGTYTPSAGEEYISPSPPTTDQIMYIDVEQDNQPTGGDPDAWEVGFEQVLASTLAAGTYDLSVSVGNPETFAYDYDGFGGYGIELLAGDTVIASDVNGTSIGEGDFETISLSLDVDGSHALLGEALGIRLYNLNLDLGVDAISGVGFDNVQLSFSAVPVPAAIWLFGTALLGLAGFNRRRKCAA